MVAFLLPLSSLYVIANDLTSYRDRLEDVILCGHLFVGGDGLCVFRAYARVLECVVLEDVREVLPGDGAMELGGFVENLMDLGDGFFTTILVFVAVPEHVFCSVALFLIAVWADVGVD